MGKPIIQVAANNTPRVIIDCGHGGSDNGVIGCNNIKEKEVSLQVGLQVAQLLRDNQVMVDLARDTDRTVLLDERTTFANSEGADLFVSIHANASKNKAFSGIETYCLRSSLFYPGDRRLISNDMGLATEELCCKYDKSNKLAHCVQRSLISAARNQYQAIDRQVRHSVAQVLLGTTMPSILVEIGFLTHEKEAALLAQKDYQSQIAWGITCGILAYLSFA